MVTPFASNSVRFASFMYDSFCTFITNSYMGLYRAGRSSIAPFASLQIRSYSSTAFLGLYSLMTSLILIHSFIRLSRVALLNGSLRSPARERNTKTIYKFQSHFGSRTFAHLHATILRLISTLDTLLPRASSTECMSSSTRVRFLMCSPSFTISLS